MGMKLHPSSVVWLDIKKQMEFGIIDGIYQTSEKVLSISEMASAYSCGKSTAQKVLEEMFDEGVLTKEKGRGYFVKPFAKERLIEKYVNVWEKELANSIKEAHFLGVDIKVLEKMITDTIKAIYSN